MGDGYGNLSLLVNDDDDDRVAEEKGIKDDDEEFVELRRKMKNFKDGNESNYVEFNNFELFFE